MDDREIRDAAVRANSVALSRQLLRSAAEGDVFFFPNCGLDWNPLFRFSDVCRTYIFCDPNTNRAEFVDNIEAVHDKTPVGEGLIRARGYSSELSLDVLNDAGGFADLRWGWCIELTRHVHTEKRKLLLYYLCADGDAAYARLFSRQDSAPKFFCAPRADDARVAHGGDWNDWRRVFSNTPGAQPKSIIGHWPKLYAPWCELWQRYRSWGPTAVYRQPGAAQERVMPVPAGRPENVTLTTDPLSPPDVVEADAIFVDLETFLRHDWPQQIQKTFLDVPDEAIDDQVRLHLPRVVPLHLSGLSMAQAMDRLTEQCANHRLHHVSAVRFGYEDEGSTLNVWNLDDWELTVHCDSINEVDSLLGHTAPEAQL